jgi:hypothetical protein
VGTSLVKKSAVAIVAIFITIQANTQIKSDSLVMYSPEYKFAEGFYPDFESVKKNSPIPKGRIISDYDYNDNNFFENTVLQKKIYYFDNLGNRLEILTSRLWGYAKNGALYINIDDGFYRITLVGSICHFIAYHTDTYNTSYYDPYSVSYPYYPGATSSSTEMMQYLFDFNTGRVVNYDVEGLEVLIMTDARLHDEFMQLSSRKKKQMLFVYLRKFNERNPLYLVKNKH